MTIPEEPKRAFARSQQRLRALLGTVEPVAILSAGGAIGLEVLLRTAVLHRAAVLIRGRQGESLARTAESLGKEVVRIVTAEDLPVDADQVDRFLDGPPLDALLVDLDPGPSGVPVPLEKIGRVVRRRRGIMLVADATNAVGRVPVEMDRWGVDAVFAASDGALNLPAGLALIAISRRLLQRLRDLTGRGTLLDLTTHHAAALEGRAGAPVAPALLQALEQRLDELISSPRP